MKRTSRVLAASLTLALLAAACGSKDKASPTDSTGGATTTVPAEQPTATEVGISATEIRIAVLADVDNALLPGLFKGSKDAVIAYGEYINKNGGIAGRQLKVDFIDTGLNPEKVKTGLQKACAEDFALVGTTLALAQSFEPMIKCKDKLGVVTGLPDFAAISVDPQQQGSAVTFSGLPPERDYSFKGGQRFTTRVAQYNYLKSKGLVSHGLYLNSADSETARNGNRVRFYAAQNVIGIKDDGNAQLVSQFAKVSDYLPLAQILKDKKSDYAEHGGTVDGYVKFRTATKQQGVTGVTYSCVLTCYDLQMFANADLVDGTYVATPFIPFFDEAEQQAVPAAKTYVDAVGRKNANGFGVQAWASALLFKQVVDSIVKANGVNGLTRASLLKGVAEVHDFTADGLVGLTDVGNRKPSACGVLMQFKDGKYVRLSPTEVGKFDCAESNRLTYTHDVWPKS